MTFLVPVHQASQTKWQTCFSDTMATTRGKCANDLDCFCYICGRFTLIDERLGFTTFVRQAYFAYFDMHLGDQDKSWAPHKVCQPCVEKLRRWTKGKRTHLSFGIPMVWREPMDHTSDCYFCQVKTVGYNERTRHKIKYPSLKSAILPIPHSD